jgi:hypothetical protein
MREVREQVAAALVPGTNGGQNYRGRELMSIVCVFLIRKFL